MNLKQLEDSGHIIYSVLAGSHLYGLNTPQSDVDIRGIFNLPLRDYVLPHHPKQINDDTNDTTYYEVVRFLDLAKTANPNILELLFAPDDKILIKSPVMDVILKNKEKFLTKACRNSLAGYAVAQIKKARGLKKLIVNPVHERKTPLDFCYVHVGNEASMSLPAWLNERGWSAEDGGFAVVNNFHNAYVLYHKEAVNYSLSYHFENEPLRKELENWIPRGLANSNSNELRLTSIPKAVADLGPVAMVSYNKDGYTKHCKDYATYQTWLVNRNPERYETNMQHGKNYDSKNMMHCMRLLKMGTELAETGTLQVYRPDRDYLMKIRKGELEYDELLEKAEEYIADLDEKFDKSDLPNNVDQKLVDDIILEIKDL